MRAGAGIALNPSRSNGGLDYASVRPYPLLSFDRRLRPALRHCSIRSPAATNGQTYPPYNIEKTGENAYRVTLAVAGFGENDLSIEAKESTLTVKGEKKAETPRKAAMSFIAASPRAPSSAASSSPTTSR